MTKFVGTPLSGKDFSSPSDEAVSARVANDDHPRFRVDAGGRITWSSGASAGDTTLYRDSANTLKTDDAFVTAAELVSAQSSGDEGGEIKLYAPQTNTTISGQVVIDVYRNKLRIFESGGSNRGAYIDLSSASTGVASNLLGGGGASTLNDLTDVVITSPEEFQTLEYNGTEWVNKHSSVISYVRNVDTVTLPVGTVVYLFGATGDHATVKRADNSSDSTSSKTIGVVGASISVNGNGPVITRGYVDGIDLSSYSAGTVLWLGDDGAFTSTKPSAPQHLVFVGVVVRATSNGIMYVACQNGYELDELHNVAISSAANHDTLSYDSGTGLWVNSDSLNLQNLTVGNLTVTGTETIVSSTNLEITDSLIYLASEQFDADALDIGIYGAYGDAGAGHFHTGLIRDASDGVWKLVSNAAEASDSVIDFTGAVYDTLKVGTLQGNVTGNLTGNVTGDVTGNVTGNVSGNAGTVTNGIYTTDTGTVTNTMLAGSIANNKLANSSIEINGSSVSLGGSISGLATTMGGFAQFTLQTSSNLASALTDETGSGSVVFSSMPTLTSPSITSEITTTTMGTFSLITTGPSTLSIGTMINTVNLGTASPEVNVGYSTGVININGKTGIGGSYSPSASLTITPTSTSTGGLLIKGLSGQSSSLTDWKDYANNSLAYVSVDGSIFSYASIVGDTYVTGNSYVSGGQIRSNGALYMNYSQSGTPSSNAHIYAQRGSSSATAIRWNETTDTWQFTNNGSAYSTIASQEDIETMFLMEVI